MTLLGLFVVGLALAALVLLPPLHPAQIWTVVWALAVGAYWLRLLPYSRLSAVTQLLLGGASLAFVGGALVGERLSLPFKRDAAPCEEREGSARVCLAATLTLVLTFFGLGAFLVQAWRSYGLRAALVSSPAVRHAVQSGAFSLTIKYVYIALAAAVLCGASAGLTGGSRRWMAGAGAAVLSTYFTTGRATVVVAAVAALCAYALARPVLPPKRSLGLAAGSVAALAVAVFTLGGSLIGKTFADSELATIDSVFAHHKQLRPAALPYEYLSAPIAAFGVEASLAKRLPRTDGCAAFGYVCSVLRHLGLGVKPLPAVRSFTARPLRWNTYTALDAPLLDGGPWLVIVAALLAGVLLGAVWAAAQRKRLLAVLCYAALAPAILTAAGSNDFTAPLLLGAILITVSSLGVARAVLGRRGRMACS